MIIEWYTPAEDTFVPGKGTFPSRFAPGAFDKHVGRSIPWTTEDSIVGTVVILSAVVDDDGCGVTFRGDFRKDAP